MKASYAILGQRHPHVHIQFARRTTLVDFKNSSTGTPPGKGADVVPRVPTINCKAHQSQHSSPLSSLQLHASAACTLRISGGQRPVTANCSCEQLELQRQKLVRCVKHEACNGDLMLAVDENYDKALTVAWSSWAVETVCSLRKGCLAYRLT